MNIHTRLSRLETKATAAASEPPEPAITPTDLEACAEYFDRFAAEQAKGCTADLQTTMREYEASAGGVR
jgi:hypothetical protein